MAVTVVGLITSLVSTIIRQTALFLQEPTARGRCGSIHGRRYAIWPINCSLSVSTNTEKGGLSGMENFPVTAGNMAARRPTFEPHAEYIESAPVVDVLFDQLAYLVAHAGRRCPRGCQDCIRLKQVKDWLMLPFRTAGHETGAPRLGRCV